MKLLGLNSPEIFIILVILLSILGQIRIEKGFLLFKKLLKYLLSIEENQTLENSEVKSEEPEKSEVKEEIIEAEVKSIKPKKKNNFFRSTYDELKLVVWPNKQQLFSESIAVIIMVSFSAAAIASVSRFYGWAASQIFG